MTSELPIVHMRDVHPRKRIFTVWERQRHRTEFHWAIQCVSEMLGTFMLVYSAIGSQLLWVLGNIIGGPNPSSKLQIGFGYFCGILFGLTVSSGTSGGHINPCVTLTFVVYKGFPPMRAVRYIIAQILGSFFACCLIYVQYKVMIDQATAVLVQAGTLPGTQQFTSGGPPSGFALYLGGQTLGRAFLNEFITDIYIGFVIWASIDPTNILVPPQLAPVVIALAYAGSYWGFSTAGLSSNTARDLGARLMVMAIWGSEAAGGPYAAIAALTCIPATIVAAGIYEFFLADSDRAVPHASLEYSHILTNHRRERLKNLDVDNHLNMPSVSYAKESP